MCTTTVPHLVHSTFKLLSSTVKNSIVNLTKVTNMKRTI